MNRTDALFLSNNQLETWLKEKGWKIVNTNVGGIYGHYYGKKWLVKDNDSEVWYIIVTPYDDGSRASYYIESI